MIIHLPILLQGQLRIRMLAQQLRHRLLRISMQHPLRILLLTRYHIQLRDLDNIRRHHSIQYRLSRIHQQLDWLGTDNRKDTDNHLLGILHSRDLRLRNMSRQRHRINGSSSSSSNNNDNNKWLWSILHNSSKRPSCDTSSRTPDTSSFRASSFGAATRYLDWLLSYWQVTTHRYIIATTSNITGWTRKKRTVFRSL